ncbi:MAG: HAMP domain-containing histidine kinase [Lachnospiraceae bacterium]|nr:HAMP domain-containing histidine kinase [Lachnospiraceae bacterium]
MLKQMRVRVILAAMLAFFAVIALIAVLVNVIDYYVVTRRLDQTISYIVDFEARGPRGEVPKPPGDEELPRDGKPMEPRDGGKQEDMTDRPFMELPDVESNYMTRFFVVRFDAEGNPSSVYTDYVAAVDETSAVQYAEEALSRKASKAYLNEYRYEKRTTSDGTVIVFLNAGRDLQYMRSLRLLSILVSCGSLVLVFILVVLFSGKAIKPIAANIRRQKEFITDASHELKTPLTSISASVDVIAIEHGEDEWTENIRSQTGRMSKLVSELVTLSRLDEDLPLPNKEHFSLSNAAWEIVEVYQPQAKAKGKSLSVDIQEDVSMVGDKTAIQQMLSVLMDNAVRYSDESGEIRFTVSKKHSKAEIEVFNTCDYEHPPDVSRLFDRFYRPDSARNRETGGTGVGLAIAKAVAEAHGGTIKAACPSGKSMTIKVVI